MGSIEHRIAEEVESRQSQWLTYGGHAVAAEVFRIIADLGLLIVKAPSDCAFAEDVAEVLDCYDNGEFDDLRTPSAAALRTIETDLIAYKAAMANASIL